MDKDNEQKPAAMISQEGPLRSITTPPFAGPIAFKNSGSFAQNRSTQRADTAISASVSEEGRQVSRHNPVGSVGKGTAQPAFRQAPLTGTPQPPTSRPFEHASPAQHPLQHPGHHQQQEVNMFASLDRAHPPQQRMQMPAGGVQGGVFQHLPPQTATAKSDAQYLFAQPAQPPPPPPTDPLSHLLQTSPHGGERTEQEYQSAGSNSARFDYGKPAAMVASLEGPLSAPAQARWHSSDVFGAGDGFRDRVASAPTPAPVPPRAHGMPALPPPPQGYSATSHTASSPNSQQHHQHGSPVPASALPPPSAPTAEQAPLMFTPRQERSLDELVSDFLSDSAPLPPEATDQDSAMSDPQGWVAALGRLARRRAWSTLVDVAGTMLVVHRGGGAPDLTAEQAINVRLRRALGLLRLGRGAEAVEAATEAREEGRQTKLAPISVAARLAAAGAKATCGRAAEVEAIDELTTLKFELEELIATALATSTPPSQPAPDISGGRTLPLSAAEATVWRRRVMSALANIFVSRGNWRLALGILETMGEEACAPAGRSEGSFRLGAGGLVGGGARSSGCRVEALSRIGRVFLQFGALKDAEVYFRRAEEAVPLEREGGNNGHVGDNARILVNRGLLLLSKNDFVSAQENFEKAAGAAAAALSAKQAPRQSDDEWDWATSGEGSGLLAYALNNLSLAMVYSCDVMRGVQTLEGLIRKDPRLYMLDVVVFNLCTLYDLSFDAVASAAKKRTLQAVGKRYRLEDIDPASYRISKS